MRALISVSDKTGIVELAQALHGLGVALISTGGTAKLLAEKANPQADVVMGVAASSLALLDKHAGWRARADVARDYDVATAARRYARLLHGPLDDEESLPWSALPCRDSVAAYSLHQ